MQVTTSKPGSGDIFFKLYTRTHDANGRKLQTPEPDGGYSYRVGAHLIFGYSQGVANRSETCVVCESRKNDCVLGMCLSCTQAKGHRPV